MVISAPPSPSSSPTSPSLPSHRMIYVDEDYEMFHLVWLTSTTTGSVSIHRENSRWIRKLLRHATLKVCTRYLDDWKRSHSSGKHSISDYNAGHLSALINGRNLGKAIRNWANFDFPGLVHLSAHINEKNRGQGMKMVILDQDRYRRSVFAVHSERTDFVLLPVGTTKHAQPIDQFLHKRLKNQFKSHDFRVSLPQIVEEIKAKLQHKSVLHSWHIVRRKFPRGSKITRTLPKLIRRAKVTGSR